LEASSVLYIMPQCIDIQATLKSFGYNPTKFSRNSHKYVIANCAFCQKSFRTQLRYITSKYVNCIHCIGVRASYIKIQSSMDRHIFWQQYQPTIDISRIDIEESKRRFGYRDINVHAKVNKRVVAKCEFCEQQYETTLISLHKTQKYTCCFKCSAIAAQYTRHNAGLSKSEFCVFMKNMNK
jgi:hypothetical protein